MPELHGLARYECPPLRRADLLHRPPHRLLEDTAPPGSTGESAATRADPKAPPRVYAGLRRALASGGSKIWHRYTFVIVALPVVLLPAKETR